MNRSGCYQLERQLLGGIRTHQESAPFHGALSTRLYMVETLLYRIAWFVAILWEPAVVGEDPPSRRGFRSMIGKERASWLYGHPLVSTLAKEKKLPSYIGSGTFASVLVDLLLHDENGRPVVAGKDKATVLVKIAG